MVKATATEALEFSSELQVLRFLSSSDKEQPGRKHITELLDDFKHSGPNGTHLLLAFEACGTSLDKNGFGFIRAAKWWKASGLLNQKGKQYSKMFNFPPNTAKEIGRQVLLGLEFIHRNGIVHGDLHTNNIILATKDLNLLEEEGLKVDNFKREVKEFDEKKSCPYPPYIYSDLALNERYTPIDPANIVVKITDFGSGKYLSNILKKQYADKRSILGE